eukprot:2940380-Ditylum_brightwellii.AAC.1
MAHVLCESEQYHNMNKIEMQLSKRQLKEAEPHKLCEPEKHQRIHKPEPHYLCEQAKHQRVCARRTRVSQGNKNEIDVKLKEPEPHELCEPAMYQGICTPEPQNL